MNLLNFLRCRKEDTGIEKISKTQTLLVFKNGKTSIEERVEGVLPLKEGDEVVYLIPYHTEMQGTYRVLKKGGFDRLVPGDPLLGVEGAYIRQIQLEKI